MLHAAMIGATALAIVPATITLILGCGLWLCDGCGLLRGAAVRAMATVEGAAALLLRRRLALPGLSAVLGCAVSPVAPVGTRLSQNRHCQKDQCRGGHHQSAHRSLSRRVAGI